jgi:hypothetical protein
MGATDGVYKMVYEIWHNETTTVIPKGLWDKLIAVGALDIETLEEHERNHGIFHYSIMVTGETDAG